MAPAARRSPNAAQIQKTAIEQAATALQELPEKPKEQLSLREAVDLMRDSISAALDKGYNYEEVAKMLTAQGVEIRPSSLKYYLTRVKRAEAAKAGGKTRKRTVRRPRTSKADAEEAPETLDLTAMVEEAAAAIEEAPAEPTPKKTTRRTNTRSTAAKSAPAKTAAKKKTSPSTRATASPAKSKTTTRKPSTRRKAGS